MVVDMLGLLATKIHHTCLKHESERNNRYRKSKTIMSMLDGDCIACEYHGGDSVLVFSYERKFPLKIHIDTDLSEIKKTAALYS